jgi:hypothetical protein
MVEAGYLCQEVNWIQKSVGLDCGNQDQAYESIPIGAMTGMVISTVMASLGPD